MSANLQIAIGGLQCSFCRQSVARALRKVPGVHAAAVNLAHEEARIDHDGAEATPVRVAQTLRSLATRSATARSCAASCRPSRRSKRNAAAC